MTGLGHCFNPARNDLTMKMIFPLLALCVALGVAQSLQAQSPATVPNAKAGAAVNAAEGHTQFKCEVRVLTKEEGGRRTPFFDKHKAEFAFGGAPVEGECQLPEGMSMVMPGDKTVLQITLSAPVAIQAGSKFEMREGGRPTVVGIVTEIIK